MEDKSNKLFKDKLYLDPIECINSSRFKPRGFRIKGDSSKETDKVGVLKYLPSVQIKPIQTSKSLSKRQEKPLLGSVIIQNWATVKNVPDDIGDLIHFPVLIDRKKYRYKDVDGEEPELNLPEDKKIRFSKLGIIKRGEKMFKFSKQNEPIALTSQSNYLPSQQSTTIPPMLTEQTEQSQEIKPFSAQIHAIKIRPSEGQALIISEKDKEKDKTNLLETKKKQKLIDFTTFNKHLYLRDNDFLYAKRAGGPVDFILCTYQDINPKSKMRTSQSLGRKILPSINNKKKTVDYLTISKNTVIHYQKGIPSVYSIQEWIDNYDKYKQIMQIPLFKNFRNAKLFDLWRRFYKKTKRQYYTEKLKKKFFFIDRNLLQGILEIRNILKGMKVLNIFELNQGSPCLLNQFNELHKVNLIDIESKIDSFRAKVKKVINISCKESYQRYKTEKKITLDDDNNVGNENEGEDKQKKEEVNNIQNFIKDSIPYAQDATRKTHYKKLLRYIRAVDYIFNETKFETINFSLDLLDRKFKRLYECYINKWVDPPMLITKILCMGDKIYYNPSIVLISEAIFDNFIQETIYCVIYKKNFIDPQEFPKYMSCFEEVFEVSVDQNSNLNNRIKESELIENKFESIKHNFELCHIELNKEVDNLRPILNNYLKNNKINFKELEATATPNQLKDLLAEFHEKEKIIKQLKPIKNIGIFEFQLDDLLDLVHDAPKRWIESIRKVIPNVLVTKVKKTIERLSKHLVELNVNPTDIENFIKLKKAVEVCNKEKQLHEDINNDIIDLQNIIDSSKEIKINDYDNKYLIELKDINVKYDRKLDSTSYFIDNNIQQFRLDLKNEITKFDNEIKSMMSELNNETLNTYNEDTFAAIDFLEENSLKIKKCLAMKDKYQQQEIDLELDDTLKSDFENLDNLVYEQELKVNLWNSVKEFKEQSDSWDNEQVLQIKLKKMKELIKKWLDLCQVSLVDLDIPEVPMELKKRVEIYDKLVPILEAIQNVNIREVPHLLSLLSELLRTEIKLDDPGLTCDRVRHLPEIFDRIPDIKELNFRANEEKRLKDLIHQTSDSFYNRKMPTKFLKNEIDNEFEFVEENLRMLNKIYLNRYHFFIKKELDKLTGDLMKYQKFLSLYVIFQKYVQKSEAILELNEFAKDNPTEHKRLLNENLKKNFYKNLTDNRVIQKFLDHVYEKQIGLINTMIQSFDQNYKAIFNFFNKKRLETPRYYLLSNDDLNNIYKERESNEIKQKMLYKIYRWIKYINVAENPENTISLVTTDNEEFKLVFTKSTRTLQDLIEFLDVFLIKKLKDNFKIFKREIEASTKSTNQETKKPKDVLKDLIMNKDNLAQGIFNCIYYLIMDNIEKSLFISDQAFDKLFDLYNDIKDDKIDFFNSLIYDKDTTPVQKRILFNLISLMNYAKLIIEILIKEDVTSNNDFTFVKIINPKIENDSLILHFIQNTFEYGYEYVGLQDNFLIMPESERMYVAFANCIINQRPFTMYGLEDNGKKEILKIFGNLCGKKINYINTTKNFSFTSFSNFFYGNIKQGCWLCIDETQNIKFEILETLALRIAEYYRILQAGGEFELESGDKVVANATQFSIFFYRTLPFDTPFYEKDIPKVVKNYYRHISLPKFDYVYYLEQSLINLSVERSEERANKMFYILRYLQCKASPFKNTNVKMYFITKIIEDLNNNITELKTKKTNIDEYLRNLIFNFVSNIMSKEEREDFRKFLNEVFGMKEYEDANSDLKENLIEDPVVNDVIKRTLDSMKINSLSYEKQIKFLYSSIFNFNSFILVGPPLSGKTNLVGMVINISKQLYEKDKSKYGKIYNVKIYSKSKNPDELFAENKVERAYRPNNNFFYNMISLFDPESEEMLNKLNEHYVNLLGFQEPEVEEDLTPEKLKTAFDKDEDMEEENVGVINQKQDEGPKAQNLKMVILDGQIDDTWIEYINNLFDRDNFLSLANGDVINCNEGFKFIFETSNLKHANPVFLTRQIIIPTNYTIYSWDTILYSWIESNPKITENATLKNYIRGLFENYFPRINEFVINNRIKTITLGPNYVLKTMINIFDSIIPMFNFEDVKIGRRNFGVVPKIEIIKKCTLSIFIFTCAWTMNLLSNFVIKTKIEKLVADIFKADDLKGPIFDYYIDLETNDFELWSNLLKSEDYQLKLQNKDEKFYYGNVFIHTIETLPYTWLCEKFITMNIPFYFNGKATSGKSCLVDYLLNKKYNEDFDILKIKMVSSYYTSANDVENCIFSNLNTIKRDVFGDKNLKEVVLYIDDLNMNIKKDIYGSAHILEFFREIVENKYMYDSKNNEIRYIKKFNMCGCGNLTAYPNDEEFNRFLTKFLVMTFVTTDDFYLNIFKPTLEFHFRKYIPNTSGITATQYLQASLKLNNLLRNEIKQEPKKLHCQINIKDMIKVIQSFHDFNFFGTSDYPEYLKKIFFYESSVVYESKFNKKEDIEIFREKICEAYNSVFKQDKVSKEIIFSKDWEQGLSYAFTRNFEKFIKIEKDEDNMMNNNNQNSENSEEIKENDAEVYQHVYLDKKIDLINYIKSKINIFYRGRDIKDKDYIKITDENMEIVIKILRALENRNPNLILIGQELIGKKPLFELACFISGIEIIEIDNSYCGDSVKTKETFITSIINPFLVNVTHKNKKTILYVPTNIKVNYIYETINKMMDYNDILNNFSFINQDLYGEISEEDAFNRLLSNLAFCIDIIPKTHNYKTIFVNYPAIVRNSSVINFHRWKKDGMYSFVNINAEKINMEENNKKNLAEMLIEIYNYTQKIYNKFYEKTKIKLYLGQKQFTNMCEFYIGKYSEYKNILSEKQKKLGEGIDIIDKVKTVIEKTDKEIEESNPLRQELEKIIEDTRKSIGDKAREKKEWVNKKQQEEKIIENLKKKKVEQQANLDAIFQPYKDAINKIMYTINKINQSDVTEIKNTWDSLNFGKYLLQKMYEVFGENNEWDTIKKILDLKFIRNFFGLNPIKSKDKLLPIIKEITSNPEFSSGDNKYQKPYKLCGTFCDYFTACNNYYIAYDAQKNLINEIDNLGAEIENHNNEIKSFLVKVTTIDTEVIEIEKKLTDLDTKKSNSHSHLLKLTALRDCFNNFMGVANQKMNIWKEQKEKIDTLIKNYDFYLMVISCFLFFAAPLSCNYRKEYKKYLYSFSQKLNLKDIKDFEIHQIFIELLDSSNKDNEFCSSIVYYTGFLADNFTMMYIMKDKISYLIDMNGMSPDIITPFLEKKAPKSIVQTIYNDITETGEMFEKLELAMKSGSFIFIKQCEENIYNILQNLIDEKFSYNPNNGKNCYLIKNKKIDKNERFKLYLIKSKPNSEISEKAFANCYVINFTCPSNVISDSIYDALCTEQNPDTFSQKNKMVNVINKDLFRLMEIEKKLLTYNKQFDFSGALDKLEHNQNILDKYIVETNTHNTILKQIKNNKKRIEIFDVELDKFKIISNVTSKIYKLLMKFFYYDNLYILPIEYFSRLIKDFYKLHFGIYFEEIKKNIYKKVNKKEEVDESEEEKEEEEVHQEGEQNGQNPEEKKEEDKDKEEEKQLDKDLASKKEDDEMFPRFHEEDSFELVIYIYNKISQIYDISKKRHLLLILLFYGLKYKEEIPANFKQIIYNVDNLFFNNKNLNKEEIGYKSPISCIDDKTWNAIKRINDCSSYIFSIIIDNIETHTKEWEIFLSNEEILLERNFEVLDEELSSTLNPFNKFLFFAIVKPNLSEALINVILKDIIKSQEVSYIDDNGETKNKNYEISTNKGIEELFFSNLSQTRKPIMIFDRGDGEILHYHDIQDFYMPKLKEILAEKNAKNDSPSMNETVSLKEICPNKSEFTNSENDTIRSAMKMGGVIFIRNCHLVRDSLVRLVDELQDRNMSIHEFFKLILVVDNKHLLHNSLYYNCNILNRDLTLLTEMKEYLIDLISSTPTNLFNRFMNSEINNSSAYYLKKLYIYFTIVIAILVQYSEIKSRIYKIPIIFQRKDYFSILAYLYKYINSISEDKQKELANPDNFYFFTYESIIKIISDVFISARMITKKEFENMNEFLQQLYEKSFFLKNEYLFFYDEFILMNIDEKKYPIESFSLYNLEGGGETQKKRPSVVQGNNGGLNNSTQNLGPKYMIPKSALIEELEKIPSETYNTLLYGISNEMLKEKKELYVRQFFNIVCINNVANKDSLMNINDVNKNKININKVIERLNDIKHNMPDLLNTTEANPVLFKVNKYNELFNPLDECLQVEINNFNNFLTNIEEDINSLLGILKGDMIFVKKYYNMIESINLNKVPKDWSMRKYPKENSEDLSLFLKKIKDRYNFFNTWIYDGLVKVYDLSLLSNDRLFVTMLPIYFQKKLPEGKASSDKIKLFFKLTKYDSSTEITDEILEEYKRANFYGNDFIFIKGLKINGFEVNKGDDKEIKYLKENENSTNNALPVVSVTYEIEEYQYEENIPQENENEQNIEESEDDEDEDEIEVGENVNEKNNVDEEKKVTENNEENKAEEKEKEVEKEKEGEKEKEKEGEEEKEREGEKEGENVKEEPNKEGEEKKEEKEEEKEKVEKKEKVEEKEKEEQPEKTKTEREIEISKDSTKINQRITIEETKVKSKKAEFSDSMKNKSFINTENKDGIEKSIRVRTKTKTYRRHCRLEIPFCEEEAPDSYNINEPYGFIEVRFNCDKDKQEEYFRNKQLKIELDK